MKSHETNFDRDDEKSKRSIKRDHIIVLVVFIAIMMSFVFNVLDDVLGATIVLGSEVK